MMKFRHNIRTVFLLVFVLLNTGALFSQIRVDFEPRTSDKAPIPYKNVTNYYLQGDFTMIGNTNLTLLDYTENITSSSSHNGNNMRYVDVDGVSSTFNSSSAELIVPGEDCSEIIYAGLYWTGRADNGSSNPNQFDVQRVVGHNGQHEGITVTVSRMGSYYPRYTLKNGSATVEIDFTNNSGASRVQYRIGTSGSFTDIPVNNYTNSNNTGIVTFTTPLALVIGGQEISIIGLQRDSRINRSETQYRSSSYIINASKQLDKRKVLLKKDNLPYGEVTATEIYFFNGSDNLYAGYSDVTEYVRVNGTGNYFVADIATREGQGGAIGYSAGWGMVVIYKNQVMKWRDITVFDGFGFMNSNSGPTTLPVSGFRAAQKGNVNIKLGMMAGEGDGYYKGDYFEIKRASDNNWQRLSHTGPNTGNATDNFFNSSINIGGAPRNPSLKNNTGVDIAMFDLTNPSNTIIPNNATSTTFRFGTNQDVYSIFNIVFAVDAYVPEVVAENAVVTAGVNSGGVVQPGDELEFDLKLYNKGDEAVEDLKIEIPIPANTHYVSGSAIVGSHATIKIPNNTTVTWLPPVGAPSGAAANNTLGGTLVWSIGNLPEDTSKGILQGTLKYKLKITDNCVVLTTSGACGIETAINGIVTGKGKVSEKEFTSSLSREVGASECSGINYSDFELTIDTSALSCDLAIENKALQFTAFCSLEDNVYPIAVVEAKYPAGVKFFSTIPTSYEQAVDVISDNFNVDITGVPKRYYAMLPGMKDCYMTLEITVDIITTSPTTTDVIFCEGDEVVLTNALSTIGVSKGYTLYYFADAEATVALTPAPVTAGTYWVAEGKEIDGVLCVGPRVSFTITIHALPVVAQGVPMISTCENNDYTVTISTTDVSSYSWEYASAISPMAWNVLDNTTFSGVIALAGETLSLSHATKAIDGIKVRLVGKNGNDCKMISNEITIEIKDCHVITNPMMPNKSKN